MENTNEKYKHCIPVVVGCVSDSVETLDLERKFINYIKQNFLNKYEHLPLVILSSMNDDNDFSIANATIKLIKEYPGKVKLLCLVSKPKEECLKPWKGMYDQEEFNFIQSEVMEGGKISLFNLPCVEGKNKDRIIKSYIVRYSNLLLTLGAASTCTLNERLLGACDPEGEYKKQTGSSYDDVLLPKLEMLTEDGFGPIQQLATDEKVNWTDEHKQENTKEVKKYEDAMLNFDRFNQKVLGSDKKIGNYFFPDEGDHFSSLSDCEKKIRGVANAADTIAGDHQKIVYKQYMVLTTLVTLTTLLLFYMDRAGNTPWFVYMGVGIGTTVIWLLNNFFQKKNSQGFHIKYRALAEGLRVQLAWKIAGLHSTVFSNYPAKAVSDLGWVRHAIRSLSVGEQSDELNEDSLKRVHKQFVEDQRGFLTNNKINDSAESANFAANIKGYVPKIKAYAFRSKSFFSVGLASVLLYSALDFISAMESKPEGLLIWVYEWVNSNEWALLSENTRIWILCFGVVCLTISVSINNYVSRLKLNEELEWYQLLLRAYEKASKITDPDKYMKKDHEKIMSTLLELGREALEENAAWVSLHSKTPILKDMKPGT